MAKIKFILLAVLIIGLFFISCSSENKGDLTYLQFQEQARAGNIKSPVTVSVSAQAKIIKGNFKSNEKEFVTLTARDNVYEFLESVGLEYKEKASSSGSISSIFWLVIFAMFPITLIFYFIASRKAKKENGNGMGFLKMTSQIRKEKPTVTFKDVAGQDEAVEETKELVDFLKNRQKYWVMGARPPKGVLLTGPPGTGKTLLGRAIAGEADVPFFAVSGSEFVQMFVGVGASRVRDLFDQAKKNSPSVIFIDELDAVGRHRGAGLGNSNDEREQTLNQILVEMDGFDNNTNIVVLAATNRPDILDPALLRPGRFDRKIILDLPDLKGREKILSVHSMNKSFSTEVNLKKIAQETSGFSGADLENLLNEAAILAVRRNKHFIGQAELSEAMERVVAGPERKSRVFSQREKEIFAFHEIGHALVGWALPHVDHLTKISIVARGNMGGYTKFLPEEDRHVWTKSQLQEMMAAALGGRVAEEMRFGEPSTGAENDLDRVREIAWKMVTRYGMSDDLPPQAFGKVQEMIFLGKEISEQRDYGDEIASRIDKARMKIIESAHQTARSILMKYESQLVAIAQKLIEKESIEGEELEQLFSSVPKDQWDN